LIGFCLLAPNSFEGGLLRKVQDLSDPINSNVLKPMIDGKGLIKPFEKLDWVIDFNDMPIEEAAEYEEPLKRVKETVKPERDTNREDVRRLNWWKFGRNRPAMRNALEGLSCYFARVISF